jgi:hypothetical protein
MTAKANPSKGFSDPSQQSKKGRHRNKPTAGSEAPMLLPHFPNWRDGNQSVQLLKSSK